MRIFETIDNVTMINESTGAFPDAAHRPAQRWSGEPFCRGNILWCWTHSGQMAPLGARPRLVCAHGPALTRMTQTRADELPSPQDIYNELTPVLGIIVAGELATTVKVGQELRGAGVGDPR